MRCALFDVKAGTPKFKPDLKAILTNLCRPYPRQFYAHNVHHTSCIQPSPVLSVLPSSRFLYQLYNSPTARTVFLIKINDLYRRRKTLFAKGFNKASGSNTGDL